MTLRFFRATKNRALKSLAAMLVLIGLLINTGSVAAIWVIISAEQGTLSGQTAIINDALAANGQAISFGQAGVVLPSPGSWTNATGNLANFPSECGNLTILSVVPGGNKIIAGVARRGLYASTNGGSNWAAMGAGSGSAAIDNRPNNIVYDPLDPNIFWVAGIYGPGVFKTIDGGNTFIQLGNISHIDYVSVDFTDPARQTLAAGGHEQSQMVWRSTNGGQTWTNVGANLPSGTTFSSAPIVIDAQTIVVGAIQSWSSGTTGIYRTTNGGASWTRVSSLAPIGATPLRASNGTIYWSAGDTIIKSSDNGLTWTQVGSGLQRTTPIELPDGRIVSARGNNLVVSADGGVTWTTFGANLPFSITEGTGIAYLHSQGAFFIRQWDCGSSVLPNAIMKLQ